MQTGLTVGTDKITGTLKFIEGGLSPAGPLAGDGYFMALKFTNIDPDATSVKIGLEPSAGTGLVEILTDPDKNAVLKITNKDTQKFKVVSTVGGFENVQVYDLSGLTLSQE